MKQFFLNTIIVLCSVSLFAQKEVAVVKTNYKAGSYKNKESLSISNQKTKDMVLLVEDSKDTKIFLLDSLLKQKMVLTAKRLDTKFKSFIGYSIGEKGEQYRVFFTNKNKKKFGMLSFNFKTKQTKQTLLGEDFGKEKYIEAISHKGKFFVITALRKSTKVNFYEYNGKGFQKKHVVSFENFAYKEDGYDKWPLQLMAKVGLIGSGSLIKIDEHSPNSIENTSVKCKLYINNDKFIFTSDNQSDFTKVITVNTNNFDVTEDSFMKPDLGIEKGGEVFGLNHNSFIYKDVMYQIGMTSQQMKLLRTDFNSKEVLGEIVLKKKDSITFKNGPIIQEGGASFFASRVRELEKTSKFLRKVSYSEMGITAFKVGDKLKLTIGGYKEIKTNGGGAALGGFGAIGGGIGAIGVGTTAFSFNPVAGAYYGHKYTKSTYMNCIFDENFNHVKGESIPDIFDIISDFEETFVLEYDFITEDAKKAIAKYGRRKTTPKLKNIFFHNNSHYFAYLDRKDRQYHLVEFSIKNTTK